MSNATSQAPPDRLHDLIAAVPNLSSTSTSKFNELRSWLANLLGITPVESVAIYYVSKPGNLDVRFNSPGSIDAPKALGVAVLANDTDAPACVTPASRFVAPAGHIECMVLCAQPPGGKWSFRTVVVHPGTPVAGRIQAHFPGVGVHLLPAVTPATATRSPAGSLSAVPLVTEPRIRRMVRLAIASAPAVMLVGPPGT